MTTPICTACHLSWHCAVNWPSWASRTVHSATCHRKSSREGPPSSSSSSRCRDHTVPWFEPYPSFAYDPTCAACSLWETVKTEQTGARGRWCGLKRNMSLNLTGALLSQNVETYFLQSLSWTCSDPSHAPLMLHSVQRRLFPFLCQNWRYINFYILSYCELSGKSLCDHIKCAPIANVFTVITSIYYESKDTTVYKDTVFELHFLLLP